VAGEPARLTAARLLNAAARAGLVLDFLAEMLQDNQSETLHHPLQQLLGDHLVLAVSGKPCVLPQVVAVSYRGRPVVR
jgi:hypothetical protein